MMMSEDKMTFDERKTVDEIESIRDIDYQGIRVIFMGKQSRGKTTAIQEAILPQYDNHFVFDTAHEYDSMRYSGDNPPARYTPNVRHGKNQKGRDELNDAINKLVLSNADKWDLIVTTEINRYWNPRESPPPALLDLNDWSGDNHLDIGWIADFRRPAQVHTDLRALADYMVIFNLTAHTDLKWIIDEVDPEEKEKAEDLKNAIKNLSAGEHIIIDDNGDWRKYNRLELDNYHEWY